MAQILIAEDDDMVRSFVSRALHLDGHDVTAAMDGLEALDILTEQSGEFDLVLSDIRMPGMDGIALAHSAAQNWDELKILLMTGYADQREREDELMKIVIDVVEKPFSLDAIRSAVTSALH